jgi:hypothetical protein
MKAVRTRLGDPRLTDVVRSVLTVVLISVAVIGRSRGRVAAATPIVLEPARFTYLPPRWRAFDHDRRDGRQRHPDPEGSG